MKKEVTIFLFLLILGTASIYLIENANLTGKAIQNFYEPLDCSETELKKMWDAIFYESSEGIIINNSGICESFFLFKNKSNESFFIAGSLDNQNVKIREIVAVHLNSSVGIASESLLDYLENENFHLIQNRSVDEVSETKEIFENVFRNSGSVWEFVQNQSDNLQNFYLLSENFTNLTCSSNVTGQVYSNKSIEKLIYRAIDYSKVVFEQYVNISDIEIDENSDWSKGFNVKDHIFGGENYSCKFVNESTKVNCTIEGNGDVKFKPEENFTGDVFFSVKAEKNGSVLYSNTFRVTIESDNVAPRYLGGLNTLIVPRTNYTLQKNMGLFFVDNDSDPLSFRITGNKNATMSFSGEDLVIKWDKNYESLEKVKVYASDGMRETASNEFYVGLDSNVETNTNNQTTIPATTSTTTSSNTTKESKSFLSLDKSLSFWIVAGIIGFFVIIFVIFLIYLIFIKKRPVREIDESSKKVEEYLQSLSEN